MKWIQGTVVLIVGAGLGFFFHSLMPAKSVESSAISGSNSFVAPGIVKEDPSSVLKTGVQEVCQTVASVRGTAFEATTAERSRVADQLARFNPQHYANLRSVNEISLMREMIGELAVTDPLQAAAILDSIQDARLWTLLSEKIISSWSLTDPMSAYRWYLDHKARIGTGNHEFYLETILPCLGEKEPEYAWSIVDAIEESWLKETMLVAVAKGWVLKNPAAAFTWLEQLAADEKIPSPTLRSCYSAVMMSYMEFDLDGAAQAIQALDSEGLQAQLVEPLVQHLAERNLIGAMVWIQQLESKTAREAGMSEIISNYAQDDPAVVLEYVLTCADTSRESLDLLCSAFTGVGNDNPDLAVSRLDQVPDEVRPEIIESITLNWLYQDEKKALAWIEDQSSGRSRDMAVAIAAQYFLSERPAVAFEWAEKVEDSASRLILLRDLITCAAGDDLTRIQSLIRQSAFGAQERTVLQEQLDQRFRNVYPELILP